MIKRIIALCYARIIEYVRDHSAIGWGIIFPLLLVLGMAAIFNGEEKPMFKVALHYGEHQKNIEHPFLETRYIHFFTVDTLDKNIVNVSRHKIDILIDFNSSPGKYWINNGSPKSYLVERILLSSNPKNMQRIDVENRQIRYVDWLVPGILGMNMMFGCLFGIGYVIVHYRKTGYLKRISATPIRAIEFLSAQIGSRLAVTMITSTIVYIGTKLIIGFPMQGSYFNLILIAMLGSISMSSLGLIFAARVSNEELANGLINIILWPMMLLSGVWFSLEGLPDWAQSSAQLLPLTHLIEAARKIMFDGAGLIDISHNIIALIIMSSLFLILGAVMFKWSNE